MLLEELTNSLLLVTGYLRVTVISFHYRKEREKKESDFSTEPVNNLKLPIKSVAREKQLVWYKVN